MNTKPVRVLVHSKSTGCSLDEIFRRRGEKYPKSAPFYGWIRKEKTNRDDISVFTIKYTEWGHGGDYYLRDDFEFDECRDMFSDNDILI